MPESPNKLLNNDHGNYVYATYTGHIFDTTLDIYFAEARFYDANTRTWLAMDPIKDGDNWYQYCYNNPLKYWDPLGLWVEVNTESGFTKFSGSDNTVHYLLNIDGAKTFGHAAMLIVNQEGEGLFYSYMASDSLWKVIGGVKSKSVMAELYGTAETFLEQEMSTLLQIHILSMTIMIELLAKESILMM